MKTILPLVAVTTAMALAGCNSMGSSDTKPATASSASGDMATTPAGSSATTMTPATNPMVGGAEMMASKNIVENASAAPNLTTLVSAVKTADLVETLSGAGPFTVFAPTNDAFGRLQAGTLDSLLKPENKPALVKVLTYHVVPGTISSADLMEQIKAGGGTATLTTVEGELLTASLTNGVVTLSDVNGNKSYIQTADVRQSNGMVHVVNGVLVPKIGG